MSDPHYLMSEDAVAQLRAEGPWADGEWADIDPDEVPYRMPWDEICRYWPLGAFLQAAALAGQVDPVLDGAHAVLKAHHLSVREEIEEAEARGDFSDALFIAEGESWVYRRMVIVLDRYIDEFEQRTAAMWRGFDESDAWAALHEEMARGADLRAKRARVRKRMAETDQRTAREQRRALHAGVAALRATEESDLPSRPPERD
jgi:hypothetical protein